MDRHQSLPPGSLNKPHDELYPPGGKRKKQEELQSCSLRKEDNKQKVRQNDKAEKYVPEEVTRQNPQEQLNEVEISKLSEKEFRVMRVKIIQDLRKRMEATTEKIK